MDTIYRNSKFSNGKAYFFLIAKCSEHAETLNRVKTEFITLDTDVLCTHNKPFFRGTEESEFDRGTDDSPYRTKEYTYLDQSFSTCLPAQAITNCLQKTVDNKPECNMA